MSIVQNRKSKWKPLGYNRKWEDAESPNRNLGKLQGDNEGDACLSFPPIKTPTMATFNIIQGVAVEQQTPKANLWALTGAVYMSCVKFVFQKK